ncbi:hypothetical protein D3C71_2204910 [compost metagenome]
MRFRLTHHPPPDAFGYKSSLLHPKLGQIDSELFPSPSGGNIALTDRGLYNLTHLL